MKETAMGDIRPLRSETTPLKGLTGIHGSIHSDTPEEEYSEADMIIVNNFLNTLAEVALAVAARQGTMKKDEQD